MAVIAGVENKGLLKSIPRIEDIMVEGMSFGVYEDGDRLVGNKTGKYTVLYFKKNIQRGFQILLERGGVYVKMQLPTSDEEIRAFFAYIRFLCGKLHTDSFICYDRQCSLDDIDELIKAVTDDSVQTLWDIRKKIDTDECRSLYISCARNPIALGKREMKEINGDLESLGRLMHRLQSMEAYYAVPAVYRLDSGSTLGIYMLSENTDSVFPRVPGDGMFLREKPDLWKVILSIGGEQAGIVDFDDLIAETEAAGIYDDRRVILRLSADEITNLIEKHGTTL